MTRFYHWLRFWVLWWISAGLNFGILMTIRRFYMTDDVLSDYFKMVAGPIDNWVAFLGIFICLFLVYLINAFYKEPELITTRFMFVSSLQLPLFGILRLVTAPFALRLDSEFELTVAYVLISLAAIVIGVLMFWRTIKNKNESMLRMLKRFARLYRDDKYW
ncbi:MAG: hypothetical protein ACE3NC_02290 [Candidatus Wallacebacter cryptica]|nr:hypothetical protein [Bacillota bacterium]